MMMKQQFTFQRFAAAIVSSALALTALADGLKGREVANFRHDTGDDAMLVPTAVAIGPGDEVLVLDGTNDRILRFGADGSFVGVITTFGDERFEQPVGLRVAADGQLWLADGGHGRILVGTSDGSLVQKLDLPAGVDGHRPDPTDVAFSPDGAAAWATDNDNHRLVRLDLRGGQPQTVGKLGMALGQFEYPFQIAITREGDLIVSDVINARLQLFGRDGTPLRNIGSYGVDPGQFARPTGVALDASGVIWVADSVTGVVQAFRQDGSFVDVLRDGEGRPMRFDAPLGLTFDRGGALYVVESRANCVRKVVIEKTAGPPVVALPNRSLAATGQQSKACTICHVEWMPAFADGRDSGLMPHPVGSKDDPAVAHADMCLSCHDGAVSDSRRRVWRDHGHRTGVKPPDTMTVPSHLPLADGKLACRTCHSAHGSDAPQSDFRRAMLLRVPNPASELCISCHSDKTRGPTFGTHPTGGMPWPIPDKLIENGAKRGVNPRELTCQVCHTPHGAKNDHLLVLGTSSNQLCVTCHDQMRPGMFRDGAHAEHPLTARMNAEQLAAVKDLGTKSGPEGQLVCLSCHKLHHGHGQRFMLAEELSEGKMCLRCHSARQEMVGSPHDLRTNFPNERDRLGLTPSDGGPCSSCHLFHRFARVPAPGPGDDVGHCLSCHSKGQCAQGKALPAVNHPSVRCTECHNPHETRFGKFLIASPENLCAKCHADRTLLADGPHDAHKSPDAWCNGGDLCLSCHRPHGDEEHGLFRMPPVTTEATTASGACVACHPGSSSSATGGLALLHPTANVRLANAPGMHAEAPADKTTNIGCRDCHDPHRATGGAPKLLRAARADGVDACTRCHSDMSLILQTAHNSDSLKQSELSAAACQPCHQVHGDPQVVDHRRLWPREFAGPGATVADGETLRIGDALCSRCHRAGGAAPMPPIATHPNVVMFAVAAAEVNGGPVDDLPLFDELGERDPQGAIACRTCHLPHGRDVEMAGRAPDQTPVGLHRRTQVRPFEAPNLCTNCHGLDALRRYLYFHDPARRGSENATR